MSSTDYGSDTDLHILPAGHHLNLTAHEESNYCSPYFTKEETEAKGLKSGVI
jgi:hypothetical protein